MSMSLREARIVLHGHRCGNLTPRTDAEKLEARRVVMRSQNEAAARFYARQKDKG